MGRFEDYNISESKMTIIVRTKEKEYSLELFHDQIDYCFDGILFSPPVYIIEKGTNSMNQIIENLSALYPEEDMDVIRKSDLISVSFSDITEVFITEEIGEESEILSWLEDEYDLQGYALFNARKIEAHYCASTGVWKVQKYFLPKYYNENGEWMENTECEWRRMEAESDNGCKSYRHSRFWTLCKGPEEGSIPVNADPKGNRYIAKKWYPERISGRILKENEPDGKESGYVIGRMTFAKREGKVNFDDCYYTDESYPDEDDFVVDEEGHLAGFLVEENIVLWISDFERGGRCYGSNGEYGDFGLVLQEYTETDFEDKEIWLAEFGYLTHSRW